MNIQQYNRIKEHFKLENMMGSAPNQDTMPNNVMPSHTPIHEQHNRQTRPGYRVPPNVAAFNNYKQMFSGQSVPDDYVPEYIRDAPLPGSQTLNTEYNQEWEVERPFDPYSEGMNQSGGYDPSQMDEYMDNFKR